MEKSNLSKRAQRLVCFALGLILFSVGAEASGIKSCALFIAAKGNRRFREALYQTIDKVEPLVLSLFAIDPVQFDSRHPKEALFDRIVWELARVGKSELTLNLPNPDLIADDLIRSTESTIVDIVRTDFYSLAGEGHLPFSVRPFSYNLSKHERKDFIRWTYGEAKNVALASFKTAFDKIRDEGQLNLGNLENFIPEEDLLDEVMSDLWSNHFVDPAVFHTGGDFGIRLEKWAGTSALAFVLNPDRKPLWKNPTGAPDNDGLLARMQFYELTKFHLIETTSENFLDRVFPELEVFLASLAQSENVNLSRVTESLESPQSLRDLQREALFESLKLAVSGKDFSDAAVVTRVARNTARAYLVRKELIKASTPSETPEDSGIPLEESSQTFNLFFFTRLNATSSHRAFQMLREELKTRYATAGFELTDQTIIECWRRTDIAVALLWSRKSPVELPTFEEEAFRQIHQQVEIQLRFENRKNGIAAELQRRHTDRRIEFWRYLAGCAEAAVKRWAPYYLVTPRDFWMTYSEAQVVDALGEEAGEWIEKKYGPAIHAVEARVVASRAIRRLLSELVKKKGIVLPEDWRARIKNGQMDSISVFDLVSTVETKQVLEIWDELNDSSIPLFAERYLERAPHRMLPGREGKERDSVVERSFYSFMEIREVLHRHPLLVKMFGTAALGKVFHLYNQEAYRLTLIYTSHQRTLPYLDLAEQLEKRRAAGKEVFSLAEEKWPEMIRDEVRTILAEKTIPHLIVAEAETPSERRYAFVKEIPVELMIAPAGNSISDEFWAELASRIGPAIVRIGRRFQIKPEQFWKSLGGYYQPHQVKIAFQNRCQKWKERGLVELQTAPEATEIVEATVRNLMIHLFHHLEKPFPEDWRTLPRGEKPNSDEIVMMLPKSEFALAYAAWRTGTPKWNASHWAESEVERALDRDQLFEDFFVEGISPARLEMVYTVPEGVLLKSRTNQYCESILQFREQAKNPLNYVVMLTPPSSYSQHVTHWMMVRAELDILIKKLPPYAVDQPAAWEALAKRYPREQLAELVADCIETKPLVGKHYVTQKKEAVEAAFTIAARMFPEIEDQLTRLKPKHRATTSRAAAVQAPLEPSSPIRAPILIQAPVDETPPVSPPVPEVRNPFADWGARLKAGEKARDIVDSVPIETIRRRMRAWRKKLSSDELPDALATGFLGENRDEPKTTRQVLVEFTALKAFIKFNENFVDDED